MRKSDNAMHRQRQSISFPLWMGIKLGAMIFFPFMLLSVLNLWNPGRVPHPYWQDALAVQAFSVFLAVFAGSLLYWYEEKYAPWRRRKIMQHPQLKMLAQLGFQGNGEYWEGLYGGAFCRVTWLAYSLEGGISTPLCLEFFCEKMAPERCREIEAAYAGEKILVGPYVVAPYCPILFRVPPAEHIRSQLDLGVRIVETYGLKSRRVEDLALEEGTELD